VPPVAGTVALPEVESVIVGDGAKWIEPDAGLDGSEALPPQPVATSTIARDE
jgi:hypothetical protein